MILAGLVGAPLVRAQERYRVDQLSCATFRQMVHSTITTQVGERTRRETAGQTGRLIVTSRDTTGGLGVEAWFDSLDLWRKSEDGRLVPETDGVIGGRYRGVLSDEGRYQRTRAPFVPSEIAELVDLSAVLDDLLPRVAPIALLPGQTWSDFLGTRITRLADSTAGAVPLGRYLLVVNVAERHRSAPDSAGLDVIESEEQRGTVTWHPDRGVLHWTREILIHSYIPAGGMIRQAVRAKVHQRIVLERIAGGCRS